MKKLLFILAILFSPFLGQTFGNCLEWTPEKLPPILEEKPDRPYEVLSPVGAGMKTIDQSRLQTQREAVKVNADAIINLFCTPGKIRREWLTFVKEGPYCRGTAIHFLTPPLKN